MEVGAIVQIQSRTWPGINKPGGAGRVSRVNEDGSVNVKYILGGTENNVASKYVKFKVLKTTPRKRKSRCHSSKNNNMKSKRQITFSKENVLNSRDVVVKSNSVSVRSSNTAFAETRNNTPAAAPVIASEKPLDTKQDNAENSFPYHVKEMVFVKARTWPGINKPGGIGRIVRIRLDSQTVDVKYVMGGSEKNVQLKYINKKDQDSQQKRESIKTDFYHKKFMDRQPRIALSLKEKEEQEKKRRKKRLDEIKTIIAKDKAKQPKRDNTSKRQTSTEPHKSTAQKKCAKQTNQREQVSENSKIQDASLIVLKKQPRIPAKRQEASMKIMKKRSQFRASNSLINNAKCEPKSPLILPPKKRRSKVLCNTNNEILSCDGSKTKDIHIRACASLKPTFSLDRTQVVEEEATKRRLAEVKETIVGLFHRERVEYLSIDLIFNELNSIDTLPPTAQHKFKVRSDRYSRVELDRIITQLDTENRVMYLRDCGTIYLI